jgi:UDP-glucose 4-epimerase
MSRTILVTGGAGYIGSITVRRLKEKGFTVVVYDNLIRSSDSSLPPNVPFIQGDISDTQKLSEVFSFYPIDAVIHFAGFLQVGESVKKPELYFENNVSKGLIFLEALRKKGINKIVFSSSAAVYGIPDNSPIIESANRNPINPYGLSKKMFEDILDSYDKAYNLKSVCLRYFNASGAAYNIGEAHDPETHLIPLILQVPLGQRENISIFGTDYNTPDGTCLRDYVHVLDLADAHIAALNYLLKLGNSEKFNVGTGQGHSVKEVISMCEQVTGQAIRSVSSLRREGDPYSLVADVSKIKNILDFEAQYGLKDIVSSAWRWHKMYPFGYKI